MGIISEQEIFELIGEINNFADWADGILRTCQETEKNDRARLSTRQFVERKNLEEQHTKRTQSIHNQTNQMMADAQKIQMDISGLDAHLSQVDKYYVKTKMKKSEELSHIQSERYRGTADYFKALENIKEEYTHIMRKYSEDILPFLINGLNYLFSAKRKQDYEELIILKNTVDMFVSEISGMLPDLTEEQLAADNQSYKEVREKVMKRQETERIGLEQSVNRLLDSTADRVCARLEKVLPDDMVRQMTEVSLKYRQNLNKVNTGRKILNGVLTQQYVSYQINDFVASPLVASLLQDECSDLIADGAIRLPLTGSVEENRPKMIYSDHSDKSITQQYLLGQMYSYLSMVPVADLEYIIIDPENRGNSIAPYFDARKKLTPLFGDRIYLTEEEIQGKISEINKEIDATIQYRLGNSYRNIFEISPQNTEANGKEEAKPKVKVLTIFDFPKGFNQHSLEELYAILKSGERCGIYVNIEMVGCDAASCSREFLNNITKIQKACTSIIQTRQNLSLRGLPLSYYLMPSAETFQTFFDKYLLLYEGMKNRGIAFPPMIRKLLEISNEDILREHINYLKEQVRLAEHNYGRTPAADTVFSRYVTLGTLDYPADIFAESPGYEVICQEFGQNKEQEEGRNMLTLPFMFDLGSDFHLLIQAPEVTKPQVSAFTEHIIWTFLSAIPVPKLNLCVFDSKGRGNSISPFLELRKAVPDIFDEKIYTSGDEIAGRLKKMNQKMDEIIQEKLGNRYDNILSYNQNTPKKTEAVTLLLIYDFPAGMDSYSMDYLMNILKNGNRCGIYAIICSNPDIPFSKYDNQEARMEEIAQCCSRIEYQERRYQLLPFHLNITIQGDIAPDQNRRFIAEYKEMDEKLKKQGLGFTDVLPEKLFSRTSEKQLIVPIGIGDGQEVISLRMGTGSSHHGLIAGATGSGKSTLLHTLIMSSMLNYTPDQLNLYLMDFKSGTEFKVYESARLPHIKLLALDAMQEFGESILENLIEEMTRRSVLFKENGNQTNMRGYVEYTRKPMPRILVIMDEFQILFNDAANRKVAMNCAELTKRIVTEGRAFGIHLLMATQSTKVISDLTLSKGTIEQMRIRIGLKCGEDDARYLFGDQNDSKALEMMKGPIGTAVMNLEYVESDNIGFRAAYCDDATQIEYLKEIEKNFADAECTTQIFEGNRTIPLLSYFDENKIGVTNERITQIYLGNMIKVAPPFAMQIDRKKRHNLLICGAEEKMAANIANICMLSVLLNQHNELYCIDGNWLVGEEGEQEYYQAYEQFDGRFHLAKDRGEIITAIREVFEQYMELKRHSGEKEIYVVIRNLQFIDIIMTMFKGERLEESEYLPEDEMEEEDILENEEEETPEGFEDPFAFIKNFKIREEPKVKNNYDLSAGEMLLKMIEDRSGYGIHFIVTCLEFQSVKESMYYGERILAKFPERILFALSDNDADSLVEGVSVASLPSNIVYYSDGIRNKFQLKPYIMPEAEQLETYIRNNLKESTEDCEIISEE